MRFSSIQEKAALSLPRNAKSKRFININLFFVQMKKTIFLMMALVAVFLLVSCAKKEVMVTSPASPEKQETTTPETPAETPSTEQPTVVPPTETEAPIVTEPGLPPSSKGLVEFYINTDEGLKRDMLFLNQQSTYVINGKEYAVRADFIGKSDNENKVIFSVNGVKKDALAVKGELLIDGKMIYVKNIVVK